MLAVRAFSSGLALLALTSMCGPAHGQWSGDSAVNLAVADLAGEQTQAKVRAMPDGGCCVSWLDNSAGGYDTRLQRLDKQGHELWPHNGVVVVDTSFSSTQDYGLAVDTAGNTVVAYRDDRFGGIEVGVNLVSLTGSLLWGVNGVVVSTAGGAFIGSPKVAALADGSYVVAWTEGSNLKRQRLDANGAIQWAAGGITNPPPASNTDLICDVVAADGGNVIISWSRNPARHLHAQKYDSAGAPLWNGGNPIPVFNGAALQFGYFPTFLHDGSGGAVFAWYDTTSQFNTAVQRISAAGTEMFPHNGVPASLSANGKPSPALAYDAASQSIYVVWVETSVPLQSLRGVFAQRFDATGTRQWSSTGKEIIPMTSNAPFFINALATSGGDLMAFWFDHNTGTKVVGTRINAGGRFMWPGNVIDVCSTPSGKGRLASARSACGDAVLAWNDARSDVNDIYAQNVNPDGSLGNEADPGDATGNGVVNVDDLLAVINAWGSCAACAADVAPVDCPNEVVNVDDLLIVINNWG